MTWTAWEALAVFLVGNLMAGGLAAYLITGGKTTDEANVVGAVGADLVFLVLMVLWLRFRAPAWPGLVGIRVKVRELVIGYGAGLVLYPVVAIGLGLALGWVFEQVTGHPVSQPEQLSPDIALGFKVFAVLLVVVIAPITEELYFRGVLYRAVRDRAGVLGGLLSSSIVFGLVHYVPGPAADVLYLQTAMVFTGLGLALLYEWRGNLVVNIAAHAAFNTIGIIAIFARW